MDRKEIEEKVKAAIVDKTKAEISEIKPASLLREELGLDSFAAIELAYEVEDKLGIIISDEEMGKLKKFEEIVDLIERKLASN